MYVIDFTKIKVSCENCNLHELCLPRGLDKAELDKLDSIVTRTQPLHRGDILFRCGDSFSSIFTVRTGCIKLTTSSAQGEEQIIGFYLPGEIVGLDGIEKGVHCCTAEALDTSSLCAIPFDNLTNICRQMPNLNEEMFRVMGREISHENQLLLTVTKKHAEGRIATFLLSLSRRYKQLGYSEMEFRLAMSRSEIGNYLGLTFETVSRTMSKLQKQGMISINHKYITIEDMDALKEICSEQDCTPALNKTASS
ncbi:MAG: fumarate/nitrate reduction transcriptional regulator Fnr [Gammaproteobacteria bacterium]|nr:fumarate/nitrate reduction transcriptional regulator Fnr [Gammaproteobacteria bacterium]